MLLGHLENGLGYYRFAYNGSDKAYVGVVAQEVKTLRPDVVERGRDGYLRVHYDRLGLQFRSYDDWVASGARIPNLRWTSGPSPVQAIREPAFARSSTIWKRSVPGKCSTIRGAVPLKPATRKCVLEQITCLHGNRPVRVRSLAVRYPAFKPGRDHPAPIHNGV